jgi:selenocysteine lyase/cysteine desulfurase
MVHYLNQVGGTYGRSAYRQVQESSRLVFDARHRLARLIGSEDTSRIVFVLNATAALNLAIQGLSRKNGKVLVSPMEHNSVMRPLSMMAQRRGIEIEVMPAGPDGRIDPERIELDDTICLAVCILESNVNGVRQPVADLKKKLGNIPLLVDGAQGAGAIPLDVSSSKIDLIAFAGHKGLLGPTGVGALYVDGKITLPPLTPGGTGSNSESTSHPTTMPDALEGGTPNIAGLAGLGASLAFIEKHGLFDPAPLVHLAMEQLERIPGIRLYGAEDPKNQGGLFSLTLEGKSSSDLAGALYKKHRIAVRSGLHCAPAAHRTLGTFDNGGTLRIAFGRFHDREAVNLLVNAMRDIA